MLKASGAMAIATLTSRILGMVREMVYMSFMGTGWVNDAFQIAFTIPNLFRRLLGEGALTAAFIPVFKEKERTEGEQEMWRSANAVISGLIVAASVIIAVVMLLVSVALAYGTPQWTGGQAADPGISMLALNAPTNLVYVTHQSFAVWTPGQFSEKTVLMLQLLRVMFPYMLLVCLAAAMMGMLNARGHFFIPAMGATMLNIVMISSVYFLAPRFGIGLPAEQKLPVQIFALAFGVLVAGVAQAAFQVPTLWRDGFRYRWVSPWRNPTVQRVVRQMIPGTIGVAAFQINVALVYFLGFWVGTGIVSSYNGAVRLMELPQGMFGISLATFLLPTLAGLAADKNYPEFRATLRHGLASLIFLNLLASVLLLSLAEPIVRLLFERGAFTSVSTRQVAYALQCLAPGLVMFSTVNILARAFYALGDTRTPMKISILCLVVNFAVAFLLVFPLREGGPGIANTLTSCINMGLLLFTLRKKLGKLEMQSLRDTLLPLIITALFAGGLAWASWKFWEQQLGHATLLLKLGAVFVPAGIAGGVYWLAAILCKIPAAKEMTNFALAKFKKRI
jgi:putative peptidoglycan lipid II flippase